VACSQYVLTLGCQIWSCWNIIFIKVLGCALRPKIVCFNDNEEIEISRSDRLSDQNRIEAQKTLQLGQKTKRKISFCKSTRRRQRGRINVALGAHHFPCQDPNGGPKSQREAYAARQSLQPRWVRCNQPIWKIGYRIEVERVGPANNPC